MLKRFIQYGERATGMSMPESQERLVQDLASDPYIDPSSVSFLLAENKRENRQWQMGVIKCALGDLVGRMIHGGQTRYGNPTDTIKSREG